jgi:hypothetical protein
MSNRFNFTISLVAFCLATIVTTPLISSTRGTEAKGATYNTNMQSSRSSPADILATLVKEKLGARPKPGQHTLLTSKKGSRLVVYINEKGVPSKYVLANKGGREIGPVPVSRADNLGEEIEECFKEFRRCEARWLGGGRVSAVYDGEGRAGCWEELMKCIEREFDRFYNSAQQR